MRCCILGYLTADVDYTGRRKLRPGDWSKQPAEQTKNDINIVKRHSLYMIGMEMNLEELLHMLGVDARMTVSAARFKDEPCKACISRERATS